MAPQHLTIPRHGADWPRVRLRGDELGQEIARLQESLAIGPPTSLADPLQIPSSDCVHVWPMVRRSYGHMKLVFRQGRRWP
jgi:hypothetical protein